MLGFVIVVYFFKKVLNGNEGYLIKMCFKVVSCEYLNEFGWDLKLIDFVKMFVLM